MANVLAIVEGAHDAAFLCVLLREEGYALVEDIAAVPLIWKPLIPTIFPARSRLVHVVDYPDIHVHNGTGHTVAVKVAGSISLLVSEMRAALEILPASVIHTVALFGDADDRNADHQFQKLQMALTALNTVAATDNLEGFPLTIPTDLGIFTEGLPRTGVYLFPDNASAGTLETLLLECAQTTLPWFHGPATGLVDQIDKAHGAHDPTLRKLRKGAGRTKAAAGIIANLTSPGSSLAVSIARAPWLPPDEASVALSRTRHFVHSMLPV